MNATEQLHLVVLTTADSKELADKIADGLVERRLAACVNIVPRVRSLYRWKGAVEDEAECVLLMKTRADRYEDLKSALAELHPYDVPELIALPIEKGSAAYLGWLDDQLE